MSPRRRTGELGVPGPVPHWAPQVALVLLGSSELSPQHPPARGYLKTPSYPAKRKTTDAPNYPENNMDIAPKLWSTPSYFS